MTHIGGGSLQRWLHSSELVVRILEALLKDFGGNHQNQSAIGTSDRSFADNDLLAFTDIDIGTETSVDGVVSDDGRDASDCCS